MVDDPSEEDMLSSLQALPAALFLKYQLHLFAFIPHWFKVDILVYNLLLLVPAAENDEEEAGKDGGGDEHLGSIQHLPDVIVRILYI